MNTTPKSMIEIRHLFDNSILFATEATSIKATVVAAVRSRARLCRAYLSRADLSWADLSGADLPGANLSGANLSGANLSGADLYGADLYGADLSGADLSGANLYGANLYGANLSGADIYGAELYAANLSGVNVNWSSRTLIAEILFRESGDDIERRKFSGMVSISRDWCWSKFLAMTSDPCLEWAISLLAKRVKDGDDAPKALRDRVATLAGFDGKGGAA